MTDTAYLFTIGAQPAIRPSEAFIKTWWKLESRDGESWEGDAEALTSSANRPPIVRLVLSKSWPVCFAPFTESQDQASQNRTSERQQQKNNGSGLLRCVKSETDKPPRAVWPCFLASGRGAPCIEIAESLLVHPHPVAMALPGYQLQHRFQWHLAGATLAKFAEQDGKLLCTLNPRLQGLLPILAFLQPSVRLAEACTSASARGFLRCCSVSLHRPSLKLLPFLVGHSTLAVAFSRPPVLPGEPGGSSDRPSP